MWKVRRRISLGSPSVLFTLLTDSGHNSARISRCQVQDCCSCKSVYDQVGCSLLSTRQTTVLLNPNGFTYPNRSLSSTAGTILVQARDPAKLSFAESLDPKWLEKAYGLVEQAFEEGKQNLLEKEPLIYLSLGLSKCGLSVPASTILRKLVTTEQYPPVTAWSAILAHMSLSAPGAYLAAELILEIGYLFQDGRVDPHKKVNAPLIAMRPNTNAFNIALAGCLLFETTRKAEQLLDMMPRIGVKADANLLIIMAHIYERNGRREEVRKLQRHIDEAVNLSDIQFRQFYNCLLSCHLKFGDLNSASKMVLEMLQKAKEARNSLAASMLSFNAAEHDRSTAGQISGQNVSYRKLDDLENNQLIQNHIMSYEEFTKDRNFVNIEAEAKRVLQTLLSKLQTQVELITTEHGILQPTEKIYVKLVKAFLEAGKTKDLAHFLIKAEKEDSLVSHDDSALGHVITLCISLGWLDRAHDLLDEMRLAGIQAAMRTLMRSRIVQKDTPGALYLFKEMKEAKIPRSGHQEFEMLAKGCAENREAGLMAKLLQEIKEGQSIDCGVHDWNNVIHFFCKKRLMQDAEKALKKMRSLGHLPNAQTFHSMVTGYAAIGGKYTEVTELWGEMKSFASATSMKFDQELLDSVLYTFVRGGFFARANEVVDMMEKGNMFIDKYKFRTLFLKYHKTLYKGKAPKFQTEAQLKKREAALALKKWVGLS
ncbi:Pentatricopeptide repeat-containing protein [Melia azedarach]|uniref:Pentatricopeptide repeat-containing protein n=2 Tax=Melia azedarach TaxID=155640 RepID=A0ACC1YW83_MELAZ|nr:Pentatricopeptide repeat-containing protein [Melia azedarach]KAJ4727439.1 Pentatricopeptide repeat-containing protein [Melia azedarach]